MKNIHRWSRRPSRTPEKRWALGGGFVCDERQPEVVDDPVHHGIVCDESDAVHLAAALGTDHRVDLVNFPDHRRQALGRDASGLSSTIRRGKAARLAFLIFP